MCDHNLVNSDLS